MTEREQQRIDPDVLEKQKDWEDIYDSSVILDNETLVYKDKEFSEIPKLEHIKSTFSMANKGKLAFIYFHQAMEGSAIFYPQTEQELLIYQIRQSFFYSVFIEICLLTIFLSPLIQNEQCFATSDFNSMQRANNTELQICVLIATFMQLLDCILFVKTTHWNKNKSYLQISNILKNDQTVTWHYLRSFITLILILNLIIYLASHSIPNLSKALIPVLFIARNIFFFQENIEIDTYFNICYFSLGFCRILFI